MNRDGPSHASTSTRWPTKPCTSPSIPIGRNINSAVAKASLTAYRYVCATAEVDTQRAKVIMDDSFMVSLKPGSHRMPLVDSAPVSCLGGGGGACLCGPQLSLHHCPPDGRGRGQCLRCWACAPNIDMEI